ncbi:hypothetical protein J2S70_001312 [Trueperella bonasi]|uniref:RloB domain-containing protein n=1 Tax=Trueperella bonasi TaxID=312286 RepID=A0ABT9NHQ0_9ACTO|nr:hypothetical protein [Trueperella bonasi]
MIAITVEPGQGEPSRVLQACDARTERERERKNINGEPFDIRILVIDVDNHQRLESTLRECKKKNIHALVTNPKFELWLLWHLEDMNHSVTGNKLDQLVQGKKLVAGPRGKELAHNFPFGNYREAMGVRGKRGAI